MRFINFKIAFRNLLKNKGYTLVNIGGLAIGLASTLLLLLYVNYEWGYDKQFKDTDRIYHGKLNFEANGSLVTTPAMPNRLAAEAKQTIPGIEQAARIAFENSNKLLSYKENKLSLRSFSVDPAFLEIFDYQFIEGNPLQALSRPDGILLTATAAKKLFGQENAIGKSIKYDNRKILTVTAVIADLPGNQTFQFEALQPWAFFDQENPGDRDNPWGVISCVTIFKLKDNTKTLFENTDAALRKVIGRHFKEQNYEAFLQPYGQIHLYNEFNNGKTTGGRIDQVRLFLFLAFCVLLIASINYMNLATARSEKRAREVGVRKAIGATRFSVMGQFLLESLLLSLFAMFAAFILLELSLPYFNNLLNIDINIQYQTWPFWTVLCGLTLFTGLLAGSYPAFYLSAFAPVKVLKGFKPTGKKSLSPRTILVVLQFSLSVCMIICAIVIYSQIRFMKNRPIGFERNSLVQLKLEGELKKSSKLELLKTTLKQSGTILSATEYSGSFSSNGPITSDISWPGKTSGQSVTFDFRGIGYDFTKTIGAAMQLGRDLSPSFALDTINTVLFNERAIKLMGMKDPIGKTVTWWGNAPFKIIGVIKDFESETFGRTAKPTIFYYSMRESNVLLLKLNPANPAGTAIAQIRELSTKLNPAYPVELQFTDENMQILLHDEKILSVLSTLFGGFAIFISCLGLLGLALYIAEQRSKEISIRKVLGANLRQILILLNKDFIKLVIIANLIAFPVAYLLAQNWLKRYDYKIDLMLWPFLCAGALSLLIALLTVSLQTFKVAKANAVDALKYE